MCIPKYFRTKQFMDQMEKQPRGTCVQIFSEALNFTVWKDNGIVFFADNDIKGGSESDIVAKVYDKKKKKWEGHRTVLIFLNFFFFLSTKPLLLPEFLDESETKLTLPISDTRPLP